MLRRATFIGPWTGVPLAWTDEDGLDEETFRADVARCCQAGAPGVYCGGSSGEAQAVEFDEFQLLARALVEAAHGQGKPAMVDCTSTYTLGALRRAEFAAGVGADAALVALPFWTEVGEEQVVPFFKEVGQAAGSLALAICDTLRAKKVLTVYQHHAIKEAVPNYLMVCATPGTVGLEVEGCKALSEFVNVFAGEQWWASLGPCGVRGSCSSLMGWAPRLAQGLWARLQAQDWQALEFASSRLAALQRFLALQLGARGCADTALDRTGAQAGNLLKAGLRNRGPYPSATREDVEALRQWCRRNYPELLQG
jgi:dihydrodipicolinate synthase/N-acetylneuraminate lyase